METKHEIIFSDAKEIKTVASESVDLVVTSPPYPMIEMWDEMFCNQDTQIKSALESGRSLEAFELMHQLLNSVWDEVYRVLKHGGFACINIGDATRTIKGDFALYPNHMRILHHLLRIGFSSLPDILWRKQTNAPNKFMGSGMLPAGAYVTLEHEYILIARKGSKREFKKESEKRNRRESAIFWEERNIFFSDVWFDVKGTTQGLNNSDARKRSAAFPFELAYRLINMYSVKGDVVLDPFWGTGTTTIAALASGRNSIGVEIDQNLKNSLNDINDDTIIRSNDYIRSRLNKHINFAHTRLKEKGPFKHSNKYYGFPVITAQEKELIINELIGLEAVTPQMLKVQYSHEPQEEFCRDWDVELNHVDFQLKEEKITTKTKKSNNSQIALF